MSKPIRLQRLLAQAGIASRRKAEELILAGEVRVNGQVARELGVQVEPGRDVVTYKGQRVITEARVWLLLNKPLGTVSTANDPEGRQTVLDVVGNQGVRLFPVGRLDYNTEGVLLLTNDGDLANALAHPRNKIPRTYHVKLRGIVDPDDLDRLRAGVLLDDGHQVAAQVAMVGITEKNSWIEMTITQGINHQIHRMVEAVGYQVLKLIRVAFAGLTVEDLRPGRYRALTQKEVTKLRELVSLPRLQQRQEAVLPGQRRARGQQRPEAARKTGTPRTGRPAAGQRAAANQTRHSSRDSGARTTENRTGRKPAAGHRDPPRRETAGQGRPEPRPAGRVADKPRRGPAPQGRGPSRRTQDEHRDQYADKPRRGPAPQGRGPSRRTQGEHRDQVADKPRRGPAPQGRGPSRRTQGEPRDQYAGKPRRGPAPAGRSGSKAPQRSERPIQGKHKGEGRQTPPRGAGKPSKSKPSKSKPGPAPKKGR